MVLELELEDEVVTVAVESHGLVPLGVLAAVSVDGGLQALGATGAVGVGGRQEDGGREASLLEEVEGLHALTRDRLQFDLINNRHRRRPPPPPLPLSWF